MGFEGGGMKKMALKGESKKKIVVLKGITKKFLQILL